jgi:ankyrin repeat protein
MPEPASDEEQASSNDPVVQFLLAACVPRDGYHGSGTLHEAESIRAHSPSVATANVYAAAVLGNEVLLRDFLARDLECARKKGGPHQWDPLTYLCFSKYLRLDRERSAAFVKTAEALLDSGAEANTGWYDIIDHPNPRPVLESAMYGAAAIAQQPELTQLLLDRGADPNDEETPYHVPESSDNTVTSILLDSGKLNAVSVTTMLLRKTDMHDFEGVRMLLHHGANPDAMTRWGDNALHHALRRDNALCTIELLLDHGADPLLRTTTDQKSAVDMAAERGRADVLRLLREDGVPTGLHGTSRLIAACALADYDTVDSIRAHEPHLIAHLLAGGGSLLAQFGGNGNTDGVRCLLELGIRPDALYVHGDGYFDIAPGSTALHVAAWRAWPLTVKELIARGAPVNARDGKGRTALMLAVKACVDSYWTARRSPDSVRFLLEAGADRAGVQFPSGYDEIDRLLKQSS